MKLPTVVVQRKDVFGRIEKKTINTTDYARDIGRWVRDNWKIVSESHQGATPDSTVDFARRQEEKEMARRTNPQHEARRDVERRYEARQGRPNIRSQQTRGADKLMVRPGPGHRDHQPPPAVDPPIETPPPRPAPAPLETLDWRKEKWMRARLVVEAKTGTRPKNKAEAEELMAKLEG